MFSTPLRVALLTAAASARLAVNLTATGADSNKLVSGEVLTPGQHLVANNGQTTLELQSTDGNLVLYHCGQLTWTTNTPSGAKLLMQTDGNLVLYNSAMTPLWYAGTGGSCATRMELQPDCNLVLYCSDDSVVWNTGPGCPSCPQPAPTPPAPPPPPAPTPPPSPPPPAPPPPGPAVEVEFTHVKAQFGWCLELPGGDAAMGATLTLGPCQAEYAPMNWSFHHQQLIFAGGGVYTDCVEMPEFGESTLQMNRCDGGTGQQWKYDAVTRAIYLGTGHGCMENDGKTRIIIAACNGAETQQWSTRLQGNFAVI